MEQLNLNDLNHKMLLKMHASNSNSVSALSEQLKTKTTKNWLSAPEMAMKSHFHLTDSTFAWKEIQI